MNEKTAAGLSAAPVVGFQDQDAQIVMDAEMGATNLVLATTQQMEEPELERFHETGHQDWSRFTGKVFMAALRETGVVTEETDMEEVSKAMARIVEQSVESYEGDK